MECHDSGEASGGLDLQSLATDYSPDIDMKLWEKIESEIVSARMPPESAEPLPASEREQIASWFKDEFVLPGGIQHAGYVLPRRLTREELQNTLEDILFIPIRSEVTNSRLHVIPDTLVEKFFTTGVIGASGFSNDARTLSDESMDLQKYASCYSLLLSRLDSDEKAREHLFGAAELPLKLTDTEVDEFIQRFGRSAFRRDLTEAEGKAFYQLYNQSDADQFSALKSSMLGVLMAPSFLFRFEDPSEDQIPVTSEELAVRLSYFLWSAPPDAELWALAKDDSLLREDVLIAQVNRMLQDPKRIALAENLGGEWFDFKKLRQKSSVDRRSDRMAGFYRTQYEESLLLFDSLLRFDQSVLRLVDADWSFLNRHQAGIYGLTHTAHRLSCDSELPEISIHYRSTDRRVAEGTYEYRHGPLTLGRTGDPDRYGFLTSGSTLSATSTENRTSPIRRGVWVMERILGRHFEVPEDVPDLEETQKRVENESGKLDFSDLLKLHSSQTGCSACHQYIDPVGFALELFDQYGLRRPAQILVPNVGEKLNWEPSLISGAYADRTWDLKDAVSSGGITRVYFNYSKGRHRLDIRNVRLINGDLELLDEHFGFTGGAQRDNVWEFAIPQESPSVGWRLIANVKGDGGNDSYGTITVAGADAIKMQEPPHRLPDGTGFGTPAELKTVLMEQYSEQIIDNAIRRVLAYALGRELLPIDRIAIDTMKKKLQPEGYRLRSLITEVVLSHPFRHKEFQ